jgi:hypothetical protein
MNSRARLQPFFLGDALALAEDLLHVPAERLALALPESLLGLAWHVPVAGLGSDRVEEAALLWRRIIRGRWFGADSREVGSACMRMLLDPETELSWSGNLVREMDEVGKAIESELIPDADLNDWIGSWLARAIKRDESRPRRHLRLA